MSHTDAAIHATQYRIYALQNLAPAIPLVTTGNTHNKALILLANIFEKATYPERSLRVVHPEQHQPIIENCPNNHAEPSRVPIVD